MKRFMKIFSFILSLIIVSTTIIHYVPTDTATYTAMKVHYIDVGQGDSVLIESNKKYMLIDAGKVGKADTIVDYLKDVGVKKLDYVIWTHPDADHIGGASKIIETFDVGKVIMPDKTHTTKTFENLLLAIKDKGLKITQAKVGNKYTIGKASFTIIAPNDNYSDNNNSSVGIKLVNGKTSFIFIGDAEKEAIDDILDNDINLKANVYMTGHHGSDTSTTEELINAIDPDSAVISVGKDNSYGHPAESTLKLLNDNKTKIYRTDENGTIVAKSDGKKVTFTAKAYKIKTTLKDAESKGFTPCSIYNPPTKTGDNK